MNIIKVMSDYKNNRKNMKCFYYTIKIQNIGYSRKNVKKIFKKTEKKVIAQNFIVYKFSD